MRAQELRIAHSADWHLGYPFKSQTSALRRELEAQAFKNLTELSKLLSLDPVDILFFAGDTFNYSRAENSDPATFINLIDALPVAQIVILPGNHDPLYPASIWSELANQLPENVILIADDREYYDLPEFNLRLFARPFKAKIATKPFFTDRLKTDRELFNILLAHGELLGRSQESYYQPLYRDYLGEQDLDLILLGHIHKRSIEYLGGRQIPAIYPGSAQALDISEVGPHGYVKIILRAGYQRPEIEFKPFSSLRFFQECLEISSLLIEGETYQDLSANDYTKRIVAALNDLDYFRPGQDIIRLELSGIVPKSFNFTSIQKLLQAVEPRIQLQNSLKIEVDIEKLLNEETFLAHAWREKERLLEVNPELDPNLVEAAWQLLLEREGNYEA